LREVCDTPQVRLNRRKFRVESGEDLLEPVERQTQFGTASTESLRQCAERVRQVLRRDRLQQRQQAVEDLADLDGISTLVLLENVTGLDRRSRVPLRHDQRHVPFAEQGLGQQSRRRIGRNELGLVRLNGQIQGDFTLLGGGRPHLSDDQATHLDVRIGRERISDGVGDKPDLDHLGERLVEHADRDGQEQSQDKEEHQPQYAAAHDRCRVSHFDNPHDRRR
jgi:hypothetical protein